MPWSDAFIEGLRSGGSLSFRLEVLQTVGTSGASPLLTGSYSWDGRAIVSISVDGASVPPVEWRCSQGAWTVTLSGVDGYRQALAVLARGCILGLYATAGGVEERISIGVLRQISSSRLPLWTVECWDLPSALMTRVTMDPARVALAYDTGEDGHTDGGSSTTYTSGLGTATVTVGSTTGFASAGVFLIGGAYYSYTGTTATTFTGASTSPILGTAPTATGGDTVSEVTGGVTTYVGGIGTATITVGSTAGFTRRTSGTGVIKIGDAYYTYTGTGGGGTTFTGCSTTPLVGTAPTPAAGDAVTHCAYWYDHPIALVRAIFTSATGGGSYAYYPAAAGYGLPEEYLEKDDLNWHQGYIVQVSAGTYQWDIIADAPVENPGGWLQDHLASAGLWITMRQGRLVVRAAQDPTTSVARSRAFGHITDEEIRGPVEVQHYDPARSTVYARCTAQAGTWSTYSRVTPGALPAQAEIVYDVSDKVLSNGANVVTEMRSRLAKWAQRLHEVVRVTVGLDRAALCPGDLMRLTTVHAISRYSAANGDTIEDEVVMVLSVTPDWMRGECRLELALLPTWDGPKP